MSRILVTTDFSARSLMVIPHAFAFARATGCEPILLHIVEDVQPVKGEPRFKVAEQATGEARHQLEDIAQTAGQAQIHVEVRQAGESVHEAILRCGAALGASIFAMASQSASAIRHVTIGSVAMGLIAHSPLPVFCAGSRVRSRPRPDGYRIAITSDGSPASEEAFGAVTPLLRSDRVPVNIIRIYVPAVGDRGDLLEMAGCKLSLDRLNADYCTGLDVETHVSKTRFPQSTAAAIIESAETAGASVIAMSTRGHSAQRHVLLGSTALDVLGRSPLPIILVPAGQHTEGN